MPPPTKVRPAPEHKTALRGQLQVALEAMTPQQHLEQSARLHNQLLELRELREAREILVCLSFGAEPDTWKLLPNLLARGQRLWIPRTVPANRGLEVVAWPCPLEQRSFGLQEPARQVEALVPEFVDQTLDAALILGLGFDRQGTRLGHGAGYFDRFLAGRTFTKIGLAFDQQLCDQLPLEPHDQAMDLVVTPSVVLRPGTT